jgi:hypothetical protein
MTAPKIPKIRPRFSSGTLRRSSANTVGIDNAPPRAMSTRPTLRIMRAGDSAATSAPAPNNARPMVSTRENPHRSASFPAGLCATMLTTRYPVTSHRVTTAGLLSNVPAIEGSATAMMVELSGAKSAASARPVNRRDVSGSARSWFS